MEQAFREESGRILATLIRFLGDFDKAEEALQDAMTTALERWPRDGVPENPPAWRTTVARRKALDQIRRDQKEPRNTSPWPTTGATTPIESKCLKKPTDPRCKTTVSA